MLTKYKTSFSLKVICLVLLSIIVPLTCTLGISSFVFHKMIIEQYKIAAKQQADFETQYLNTIFKTIDNELDSLISQLNLDFLLQEDMILSTDTASITDSLIELCYNNPNFSNAYILSVRQQTLYSAYSESTGKMGYPDIIASKWHTDTKKSYIPFVSMYPYGETPSIAFTKPIRDPGSFEYLGYCMVKLNLSILNTAFKLTDYDIGFISCFTDELQILASSGEIPSDYWSGIDLHSSYQQFGKTIAYCTPVPHSNLYIAAAFSSTTKQIFSLKPFYIGIVIALVCVNISVIISIYLLQHLLTPLHKLADEMEKANPDHLEILPVSGRYDEIGILEAKYNEMIIRVNQMIDSHYRATLSMQEAQLKAMQLQINPHFINNTLQLIGEIAVEHGMFDLYDLILSFSGMFYYSLKYKGNTVTLKDEMDYMINYVKIQQARYPEKFTFETMIDSSTESMEIPKISIQPIVENCFRHAFIHMKNNWKVTIFSQRHENYYEVSVTDNGCGIPEEKIEELQDKLQKNYSNPLNATSHIGILNVNSRIRFLYGTEYGITIHTTIGIGTEVILKLPIKNGGG